MRTTDRKGWNEGPVRKEKLKTEIKEEKTSITIEFVFNLVL